MKVNEVVQRLEAAAAELEAEFRAAPVVNASSVEEVEDLLRCARSAMGKVNPAVELTSKASLGNVQRWIVQAAADAVYARGGDRVEAETAKEAMDERLDAEWTALKVAAAREKKAELEAVAAEKGYKPGWVFFQLKDAFGSDVANEVCPR